MEKQTLRLNLPYGQLGLQPLKPLGSEFTHLPWPPSVRCGILKCWKLKNYFFYSFSLFFLYFFLFSHTTGQKSAYLIGETDSTAKFTLWAPWTATSHTPWIRSYTPSLATISTYHQPPLSFTYQTLLHNPVQLPTQQPPNILNHMDMHDACRLMQAKLVDFLRSDLV